MNTTANHQRLVDDLLFAVGSLPYARVWKQITGTFKTLHGNRIVKIGLPGQADIGGIVRTASGSGVRLEIECKTGGGKLNADQMKYRDMILTFGGVYIQARDIESVLQTVKGMALC